MTVSVCWFAKTVSRDSPVWSYRVEILNEKAPFKLFELISR